MRLQGVLDNVEDKMIEFQAFPKIPRYRREIAVTEKIDGTNAAVVWAPFTDGDENGLCVKELHDQHGAYLGQYVLLAQSRQRFITPSRIKPKNDNYAFAQWVDDHADELTKLGPGYRRMVGLRHPTRLRHAGEALQPVQRQPVGRRQAGAAGVLRRSAIARVLPARPDQRATREATGRWKSSGTGVHETRRFDSLAQSVQELL